jgi:hypothetical protein
LLLQRDDAGLQRGDAALQLLTAQTDGCIHAFTIAKPIRASCARFAKKYRKPENAQLEALIKYRRS